MCGEESRSEPCHVGKTTGSAAVPKFCSLLALERIAPPAWHGVRQRQ